METAPAVMLGEGAGVWPGAWGPASTKGRRHPRCPMHLPAEKQTAGSLLLREQIWGRSQDSDVQLQYTVLTPCFSGLGDNALCHTIQGRM